MSTLKDYLRHLFIPQESNNFKAKTLHIDFLSFYLIAALLLVITTKNVRFYMNSVLGYATDISVTKLLDLTNQERTKHGLSPLIMNDQLSRAASSKAGDMFAKNYWAHFGPDGLSPWDFIIKSGYQYEYAGENLAKNFLFSQGVVDAWMNSPTHRDNLLKKEYSEVGFAIVNGMLNGEETTLVVQMFGTPLMSLPPLAKVPPVQPIKQEAPQNVPISVKLDSNLSGNDVQKVLDATSHKQKINLFSFSIDITYIFIMLFSCILIADLYIASKLHVVSTGGKPLAHLIFLGFVFVGMLLLFRSGSIL